MALDVAVARATPPHPDWILAIGRDGVSIIPFDRNAVFVIFIILPTEIASPGMSSWCSDLPIRTCGRRRIRAAPCVVIAIPGGIAVPPRSACGHEVAGRATPGVVAGEADDLGARRIAAEA